MPTPTDTDTRPSLWKKALGNRRFRKQALFAVAGLAAVGVLAAYALNTLPAEESGWLKHKSLPKAKPVWTDSSASANFCDIHDDVLVVGNFSDQTPAIYDLAGGDKLMTNKDAAYSWLSGDHMVVSYHDVGKPLGVYDIHTGERSHTIKVHESARYTVASGLVVVGEQSGNEDVRLRAVEVSTGKEQWTKKLSSAWFEFWVDAPKPISTAGSSSRHNFGAEAQSPIVFTGNDMQSGQATAIDVKTGKKRWTVPIDGSLPSTVAVSGYYLTADNDIFIKADDGTHIIDSQTGDRRQYPAPPKKPTDQAQVEPPLHGNLLLTTEKSSPAVVDVTTGKTVWRSKHPNDAVRFHNGVFFEKATANEVTGLRAIDVKSGKTLWTREDPHNDSISVAGDAVVIGGDGSRHEPYVTRIFDRDSGEGLAQLEGTEELVVYNDEYLVFASDGGASETLSVLSTKDPEG